MTSQPIRPADITRFFGCPFVCQNKPFIGRTQPLFRPIIGENRPFVIKRADSGFTLIELVIVVTIFAVMAAWALPGFRDMVQRTRLKTETADFVQALQLARTEAIKQKTAVEVCASNYALTSGDSCTAGLTDWDQGWVIWTDKDGSAGLDDPENEVIRAGAANRNDFTISTAGVGVSAFQYLPSGLVSVPNMTFAVCDSSRPGTHGRNIVVSATGRPDVSIKTDCP